MALAAQGGEKQKVSPEKTHTIPTKTPPNVPGGVASTTKRKGSTSSTSSSSVPTLTADSTNTERLEAATKFFYRTIRPSIREAPNISTEGLLDKIQTNTRRQKLILVDCRTGEERAVSYLRDSMSLQDFELWTRERKNAAPDTRISIEVVCYSLIGKRSGEYVAKHREHLLRTAGLAEVYNYDLGLVALMHCYAERGLKSGLVFGDQKGRARVSSTENEIGGATETYDPIEENEDCGKNIDLDYLPSPEEDREHEQDTFLDLNIPPPLQLVVDKEVQAALKLHDNKPEEHSVEVQAEDAIAARRYERDRKKKKGRDIGKELQTGDRTNVGDGGKALGNDASSKSPRPSTHTPAMRNDVMSSSVQIITKPARMLHGNEAQYHEFFPNEIPYVAITLIPEIPRSDEQKMKNKLREVVSRLFKCCGKDRIETDPADPDQVC